VYEAFYNWMCPLGTGLLNQNGGGSRELLNLFAARYIVFDKTDPGMQSPKMQQLLADYRQAFPVAVDNEDFAVLRNDTAHPYVSATTKLCLFTGDVRRSPQLALALSGKSYTLVHDGPPQLHYERTYDDYSATFPPVTESAPLPLGDVQLTRENSQVVRIKLNAPEECVAVIAESYYPFWRASVDGQSTEVLRVDCALMGVQLPVGLHEIVLRYQPPRAYALAGVVSALTLLTGIFVAVRRTAARSTS
jgi:uncharacterized membrane protein YfhO